MPLPPKKTDRAARPYAAAGITAFSPAVHGSKRKYPAVKPAAIGKPKTASAAFFRQKTPHTFPQKTPLPPCLCRLPFFPLPVNRLFGTARGISLCLPHCAPIRFLQRKRERNASIHNNHNGLQENHAFVMSKKGCLKDFPLQAACLGAYFRQPCRIARQFE